LAAYWIFNWYLEDTTAYNRLVTVCLLQIAVEKVERELITGAMHSFLLISRDVDETLYFTAEARLHTQATGLCI
jgi:hypothetical protein